MQAEVVLLCQHQSGVLARVVISLRKHDLKMTSFSQDKVADHNQLTLSLSGRHITQEELISIIDNVPGVADVVSCRIEGTVDEQSVTPDKGLPEMANSLVGEMVKSFPDIKNQLDTLRESIDPNQYARQLTNAGIQVGLGLIYRENIATPQTSVRSAMRNRIGPLLLPVAECELAGAEIRVSRSLFTTGELAAKSTLLSKQGSSVWGSDETPEKCWFLAGLMTGLLSNADSDKLVVEETRCRKDGFPDCRFQMVKNSN